MFRAIFVALVTAMLVVVIGTPVFILGLIYPARGFFAWPSFVWGRCILAACGVRLQIDGQADLGEPRPRFFVGNHQSALDIPVLIVALRGNVRFMAKESLFRIPILGWNLHRYDHVPIDRKSPRVTLHRLERMIARIRRAPISLIVFPEGTRSPDGELLPFRKGAMRICQRAGLDVVPFSICGSQAVLDRAKFRVRPGAIRLRFGEAIAAADVSAMTPAELHDRVYDDVARGLGVCTTVREAATTE